MDNISVPKKVNRHILKAINSLTKEPNKKYIQEKDIVLRVKYQMRNLIPLKNVEYVIRMALYKLQRMGILMRKNNSYGIRRALDELQVTKPSVVSKNIENSDHGSQENPCCSKSIELHHATKNKGTQERSITTSLAPDPSFITVATGGEALIENSTSQIAQEPVAINFPSGSNILSQIPSNTTTIVTQVDFNQNTSTPSVYENPSHPIVNGSDEEGEVHSKNENENQKQ